MNDDNVADLPQVNHKISTVENFYEYPIEGTDKTIFIGRTSEEIGLDIQSRAGNWPRRVGGDLFALIKGRVYWIRDPSELSAWLCHARITLDWRANNKGSYIKLPSKQDLMSFLKTAAKDYCSIQELPHFPQLPSAYYAPGAAIQPEDNGSFVKLLKYFKPHTPDDSLFLSALFLTPFWGGQPGGRPLFIIDGPPDDPDGGRGVGKSELVDIVSMLAGGYIDVPASIKDPDEIKKRILNAEGPARIIRYDNVKKNRFSSEVFESLITSSSISGHRLYTGHASRPNYYTYIVTFNDASLSKDLASRAVRVRLARPDHDASEAWGETVRAFVAENRGAILANILWFLAQPSVKMPLDFRFPSWVAGVLSKVCGDDDGQIVQKMIKDKASMDDEDAEIEDVEQCIYDRLKTYSFRTAADFAQPFDPETQNMFIPWAHAVRWLREDMGLQTDARRLGKRIRRSQTGQLSVKRIVSNTGLFWTAPKATSKEMGYICPPDYRHVILETRTLHKMTAMH